MTPKEFANSIGITKEGTESNNRYVVELSDSNEYSRVYTILDKAPGVDLDSDESILSETTTQLVYLSDDFDIKLIADLDKNNYSVVIERA